MAPDEFVDTTATMPEDAADAIIEHLGRLAAEGHPHLDQPPELG